MNCLQRFLVKPGTRVKLRDIDPDDTGKFKSKEEVLKAMERNNERLRELQETLYAEHKQSLLICLQALDTGGKDGTISHVLGAMNPQGCKVVPFKQPNHLELDHDFLWRAHRDAPLKGEVAIFNRSHYEDVLIVRVHNLVPKSVWQLRYEEINAMEKYLSDNGTHILKFFLHISKDEQLKRFKARLDDPTKQWKISEADYSERALWDGYIQAFDDALSKCSTSHAPWFVIPANHKWFRDFAVSEILVRYLEGLKLAYPKPTVDLEKIRAQYRKAKKQS